MTHREENFKKHGGIRRIFLSATVSFKTQAGLELALPGRIDQFGIPWVDYSEATGWAPLDRYLLELGLR